MRLRTKSVGILYLLIVAAALTTGAALPHRRSSAAGRPKSILFASYVEIPRSDEVKQLNQYSRGLRANKTAQGYIICYGGRYSTEDVAQERADRAKQYLINIRGVDADRIVTVEGGYKEEPTTELWLVPSGATPPHATPTVEP